MTKKILDLQRQGASWFTLSGLCTIGFFVIGHLH